MTDLVDDVITRHRKTGIVVDTNVLLLFLIGSFGRDWVSRFKNTNRYVPEDYDTINSIVGEFDKLIATPNILTELSNLAGQRADPAKTQFFTFVAEKIFHFIDERYIQSGDAVRVGEFSRLGLTDVGIALLADSHVPVLTDDFDLYVLLSQRRVDVINFNHIRPLGWKT